MRSLLLPTFNRPFFRGSQTNTCVMWGLKQIVQPSCAGVFLESHKQIAAQTLNKPQHRCRFRFEDGLHHQQAAKGQYRVLFRLAYATDMRAGELFGLYVDDFKLGAGTVRVTRTHRKVEKVDARSISIHSRWEKFGRFSLIGHPVRTKLGTPHGWMRAFRHGRVSKMQSAGVNEKVIRTEIGHSSLRMTRRYTHYSHEQRRELAEKLAPSLSQSVPISA